MPNREAKDAEEAKALADIEEYGCHILYVLEEDEHPLRLLGRDRAQFWRP
jgi:hypothetical protein